MRRYIVVIFTKGTAFSCTRRTVLTPSQKLIKLNEITAGRNRFSYFWEEQSSLSISDVDAATFLCYSLFTSGDQWETQGMLRTSTLQYSLKSLGHKHSTFRRVMQISTKYSLNTKGKALDIFFYSLYQFLRVCLHHFWLRWAKVYNKQKQGEQLSRDWAD